MDGKRIHVRVPIKFKQTAQIAEKEQDRDCDQCGGCRPRQSLLGEFTDPMLNSTVVCGPRLWLTRQVPWSILIRSLMATSGFPFLDASSRTGSPANLAFAVTKGVNRWGMCRCGTTASSRITAITATLSVFQKISPMFLMSPQCSLGDPQPQVC
jgi:hypothetical protein